MSAVQWKRLRSFNGAPPCEGGCRSDANARGVGVYRLTLCGWPAGFWCLKCRKAWDELWTSAHNPKVETETTVREAVAA